MPAVTQHSNQPTIIIDTREQLPYDFAAESTRAALKTGDYSLAGMESLVAVERKSLNDFVSCITTERGRFERELCRADHLDRFWIVIESSLTRIEQGLYRSKVNPESVLGTLAAWSNRHKVSFVFADNRQSAAKMTERLLRHAWNEHQKKQASQPAGIDIE
jgi:DNA excision repair protein ERCC-4